MNQTRTAKKIPHKKFKDKTTQAQARKLQKKGRAKTTQAGMKEQQRKDTKLLKNLTHGKMETKLHRNLLDDQSGHECCCTRRA